jgi:hypothetical protein
MADVLAALPAATEALAGSGGVLTPRWRSWLQRVARAVDDYEEGTWQPGLAFGGASAGIVYDLQEGHYTRIRRQVFLEGHLRITSKGSSTGAPSITGLPCGGAVTTASGMSVSYYAGVASVPMLLGYPGGTVITMLAAGSSGVSALTQANFTNGFDVVFSLNYHV